MSNKKQKKSQTILTIEDKSNRNSKKKKPKQTNLKRLGLLLEKKINK